MKTSLLAAATCVATLLGGTAFAATSNMLVNGGFEDFHSGQNVSNWKIFSDVPGWDGTPNIEVQSNTTLGSIDAQAGSYYVELDTDQNTQITQTVENVSAGSYLLEFFYSPRVNAQNTDTNDMRFGLSSTSGGTDSHDILGAPVLGVAAHGVWTKFSAMITAADGDDLTVSFQALGETSTSGCGNCGALIDTVSLSLFESNEDTAPVPLPAGGVLILTGLGGLMALRKRRGA